MADSAAPLFVFSGAVALPDIAPAAIGGWDAAPLPPVIEQAPVAAGWEASAPGNWDAQE